MRVSLVAITARLPAEGEDPAVDGVSGIRPRFDVFPFMDDLMRLVGGGLGLALVALVALCAAGAVLWVVGRFGGSGGLQKVGASIFAVCFGAALWVGFAGGFTQWSSSFGADWWG